MTNMGINTPSLSFYQKTRFKKNDKSLDTVSKDVIPKTIDYDKLPASGNQ